MIVCMIMLKIGDADVILYYIGQQQQFGSKPQGQVKQPSAGQQQYKKVAPVKPTAGVRQGQVLIKKAPPAAAQVKGIKNGLFWDNVDVIYFTARREVPTPGLVCPGCLGPEESNPSLPMPRANWQCSNSRFRNNWEIKEEEEWERQNQV